VFCRWRPSLVSRTQMHCAPSIAAEHLPRAGRGTSADTSPSRPAACSTGVSCCSRGTASPRLCMVDHAGENRSGSDYGALIAFPVVLLPPLLVCGLAGMHSPLPRCCCCCEVGCAALPPLGSAVPCVLSPTRCACCCRAGLAAILLLRSGARGELDTSVVARRSGRCMQHGGASGAHATLVAGVAAENLR
jgi:hypothetical protein